MKTNTKLHGIIYSIDDLPSGIYEINIWDDNILYKRIILHSGIINISKLVDGLFHEETVDILEISSSVQFLIYNDLYNRYV